MPEFRVAWEIDIDASSPDWPPPKLLKFRAALDNHEHPRGIAVGELELHFPRPHRVSPVATYVLRDSSLFANARRANYIIDDGQAVIVTYVAGWSSDDGRLFLHPFPLNVGVRPDNGQPVNMDSWMLGPRRTYHLKVAVA